MHHLFARGADVTTEGANVMALLGRRVPDHVAALLGQRRRVAQKVGGDTASLRLMRANPPDRARHHPEDDEVERQRRYQHHHAPTRQPPTGLACPASHIGHSKSSSNGSRVCIELPLPIEMPVNYFKAGMPG